MSGRTWYSITAKGNARAEIVIDGEIGAWGITAKQFRNDLRALGDVKSIDLLIDSRGGEVFEGWAIHDALKDHPATVDVKIVGLAASMASAVALVGETIVMTANAWWMMHEPRGGGFGTKEEVQRSADLIGRIRDQLVTAYAKRSGQTEDKIRELIAAETWLNPAQAKEMGFVDEVTGDEALAACADLSEFKNVPDAVRAQFQSTQDRSMPHDKTGAAPNKAVDEPSVRAQALADEKRRREDIRVTFGKWSTQYSELLTGCLEDMDCTKADAGSRLLAALGKESHPIDKDTYVSTAHDPIQNHFMEHAENAIAARAGLEKLKDGNQLRGCRLGDLARLTLDRRGVATASMDRMTIVAGAFTHTSGDFSRLLGNTATKSMMKGFDEAEENFQKWTSVGTLPDFKTADRIDIGAFPSLLMVREGAEFKYATFGDRREQIALATYGNLFSITRQAIINDDLNAFTRIPQKMGAAAKRTVADLAYGVLTTNAAMADGVALFHATHGNLAGAGTVLSSVSVDAGCVAMGVQTYDAAYLNIRPAFLLVPIAKGALAKQTMEAEFDPTGNRDLTVPNPVRRIAEPIPEARLTGTAWYLVANPAVYDTVEIAYLDGNQAPVLEQQTGWNVDGVEYKVRIDATAKALEHRTMYKNPGA